jgi:hypothetical protein
MLSLWRSRGRLVGGLGQCEAAMTLYVTGVCAAAAAAQT